MSVSDIKFVDREDECRLACHPDLPDLRGRTKASCVVVAKQPGAGKTLLGQECLKVARSKPPQNCDPEEWKAKLPVLTLHCEAKDGDTLPDLLIAIAEHATERLKDIQAGQELEIGTCEKVEIETLKHTRGYRIAEGLVAPRTVWDIFNVLKPRAGSLGLSKETAGRLDTLRQTLVRQPLLEWDSVVLEFVEDESEAKKVYEWLRLRTAALRLREVCGDWKVHFKKSDVNGKSVSRPVALLIVVDEAQWVLPGGNMDKLFSDLRQKRREIRETKAGRRFEETDLAEELLDIETKIKHARDSVKEVLEAMQAVFTVCRFLWTGVSSAAVELQMSKGDSGTGIRVISMALPPLDLAQWTEALGSPSEHGSPMERMLRLRRQQKQSDEPSLTVDSVRSLQDMMRCTGGWPSQVQDYVETPDRKQWAWVDEVFGGDREQLKRIGAITLNLLDRVYLDAEKSVFQHLQAIDFVRNDEMGRTLYELHHLSGLRLVDENGVPAIYVPNATGYKVVGVTVTSGLDTVKLRHTTGSLWLQARLSQESEIGIFKGGWERYTLNEAEGATINMLRFLKELGVPQQLELDEPQQLELDEAHQLELAEVFPWLKEAPREIARMKLQTDELCVVRGLKIEPEKGQAKLQPEDVPGALERHGEIINKIKAGNFQKWFGTWCTGWSEKWNNGDKKTYIYVFGERSASGDILLILGGIHIHIQIKNAKKSRVNFEAEVEKMKNVSWNQVPNVFVLINYYTTQSRPYDEMSRQRTAYIQAAIQEFRNDKVVLLPPIPELCLVVVLQGLWERRLNKDINEISLKWYLDNVRDPELEVDVPEKQPPTKIRRVSDTAREEFNSEGSIGQKQPAAEITSQQLENEEYALH